MKFAEDGLRQTLESLIRDYEERRDWAYREIVAATDLIAYYGAKIDGYREDLKALDE